MATTASTGDCASTHRTLEGESASHTRGANRKRGKRATSGWWCTSATVAPGRPYPRGAWQEQRIGRKGGVMDALTCSSQHTCGWCSEISCSPSANCGETYRRKARSRTWMRSSQTRCVAACNSEHVPRSATNDRRSSCGMTMCTRSRLESTFAASLSAAAAMAADEISPATVRRQRPHAVSARRRATTMRQDACCAIDVAILHHGAEVALLLVNFT